MPKQRKIVSEAERKAKKYLQKYGGCAQATFKAISDVFDLKCQEKVFKSMVRLSGGIADLGTGSCGAITGAAAAMSLYLNQEVSKCGLEDREKRKNIYREIAVIGQKFEEEFDGIQCREVQMNLYGFSFNLWNQEAYKKFSEIENCEKVVTKTAKITSKQILKLERQGQNKLR